MLSIAEANPPPGASPWGKGAIFGCLVAISAVLGALPANAVEIRNLLHHLNSAPLMLAGILYGRRMAVWASVFAFLVESFNLARALRVSRFDAFDLGAELAVFGAASLVAGGLSDRARGQRSRLRQAAEELSRVYRELSENVEQLKKAERLQAAGQLSASLAHEIRNPLASISGAAGLLKRSYRTEAGQVHGAAAECLDIIEKESQRLNKLLSAFLEFARPRAPRFQMAVAGEVLQSVASLVAHSTGRAVDIRWSAAGDLPALECDPEQLKQVILNLAVNSVQASPDGGVVELAAFLDRGRMVIEVRDQGQGIDQPQVFEHMFEPFFTTKENGSGLGLAISAKIVEQHSGRLEARNNPDRGMTFRVELPLTREGSR